MFLRHSVLCLAPCAGFGLCYIKLRKDLVWSKYGPHLNHSTVQLSSSLYKHKHKHIPPVAGKTDTSTAILLVSLVNFHTLPLSKTKHTPPDSQLGQVVPWPLASINNKQSFFIELENVYPYEGRGGHINISTMKSHLIMRSNSKCVFMYVTACRQSL